MILKQIEEEIREQERREREWREKENFEALKKKQTEEEMGLCDSSLPIVSSDRFILYFPLLVLFSQLGCFFVFYFRPLLYIEATEILL